MFKPPTAPVSVLEAPFQITIEFTDYASYQHHQFRRQQYQQQLEIQERNQRHEEQQRQCQAQFQSQMQSQYHVFHQPFPTQQAPAFAAPFQQPFPSNLPSNLPSTLSSTLPSAAPSDFSPDFHSELPAGPGLIVFQQQERPVPQFSSVDASPQQQDHTEIAVHGRSNSLPETAVVDINANIQDVASRRPTPLAHTAAINGFVAYRGSNEIIGHSQVPILGAGQVMEQSIHLMHHAGYQTHPSHQAPQAVPPVNIQAHGQGPQGAQGQQGQLLSATPANVTAPSPIDPLLAHTPTAALATGTFPANSPPVCNNTDIQHLSSTSPTYFAPPHHHNSSMTVAPASSTVPSSPHPTTSSTSPTSTGNSLRHLSYPRRHQHQTQQQHQHHANFNTLNDHQSSQHTHPFNYHQHLHQQIQKRRLKKAHTFPVVHPSVYAFPSTPQYNPSANSLPSQLLEQQQQQQQQQQQTQQTQTQDQEHFNKSQYIYPTFTFAAMAVGYDQVTALNQAAIDAEIAAQQAAAQNYQPGTEGPGIDEIHITEDIQELYANADISFVEKTAKLPRAFPLYRPVRGDGNCGWRAIGFCYFELLVHSKNAELVTAERARLLGLNDYIHNVGGYSPYVYEDMVEETDFLFGKILDSYTDDKQAMMAVSEAFNDIGSSHAIIYHLRLLTSSYLKEHAEKYEGFLGHIAGVNGYCEEFIERPNCEIDHLRLELLANVLLKSSDMVLEIAYLDRSESEILPMYRFPEPNVGRPEGTISLRMSLLFRPDHYDILYRPSLPSREVAEAALSRFHTPENVATALTLDWERAATIVAGEPVEAPAEPEAPAESEAAVEQKAATEPEAASHAPTVDSFPLHPPVPIYEDTPDLTPGSSINSPALFQAKGEPLTPILAPTGAPPQAIPNSGPFVAVSATAEPSQLPISSSGADTLTPTAAAATPVLPSSDSRSPDTFHASSSKRVKLDSTTGAASETVATERSVPEEQASSTQDIADSAATSSLADAPTSNDYKVFHVGSITYGNPHSNQSSQSSLVAGSDLFSQLPFLFGTAPSETNSALFGTGNWSSSSLRSRHSDTFAASPLTVQQPRTPANSVQAQAQAQATSAENATTSTPVAVPASDLMPPPPPPPVTRKAEPPKETQPGATCATENQREPVVVRFTQWHYKEKKLSHNAMDRESTSFRSKIGTQSHFNSNEFQPDMYNPAGSGRRGGGTRFHKHDEGTPDSQW